MSKYRNRLPQLHDGLFLTDGGLETTLIYHDGVSLTHFAAFDLLKDDAGLGPRGDGYRADFRMRTDEARDYHAPQIQTFARTDADMVAAFTMNYVEEAIGIAMAASDTAMPVAISFTVETDGCLPSGDALADAIARTDAETASYPAYYMINCAHPTHFEAVLRNGGVWRERIRGVRANASKRSHAELDASADLDCGDPAELGTDYRRLQAWLPKLCVVGGCCGTDHRHVEAIADCLQPMSDVRICHDVAS